MSKNEIKFAENQQAAAQVIALSQLNQIYTVDECDLPELATLLCQLHGKHYARSMFDVNKSAQIVNYSVTVVLK